MIIKPKEFKRGFVKEAEISGENFDGGEYEAWFVREVKEGEEEYDDDQPKKIRDNLSHIQIGEVYINRMDVNVDVDQMAFDGERDLHVKNIKTLQVYVLVNAATII